MKTLRAFLLTVTLASALAACSGKKDDLAELSAGTKPPVEVAPPITPEPKKPEPPKYVYPFLQQRDPFVPLIGAPAATAPSGTPSIESFSNLELRGILQDRRGKIALISSTDGESYVLRSGRVYDRRNRMISGVQGIIKENSVVLISKNKTVRELTISRKEGSAR